jgi:hypothetical protein
MNKLTNYLLSLFTIAINSDLCAVNQLDEYTPRKVDPRTRNIRLAVESIIGKNYGKMYSDKLKYTRKVKFYNIAHEVTQDELSAINQLLDTIGVQAVIRKKYSLVVKYAYASNHVSA